jgi:hypothetical protein
VSKQAVSQLVEILVRRGYRVRRDDPEDGRRVELDVTERGQAVVDAVVRACDSVDEELAFVVSKSELLGFRKALTAPAEIKVERALRGAGKRRPRRRPARFEPIFPVRDLTAAMAPLRKSRVQDPFFRPTTVSPTGASCRSIWRSSLATMQRPTEPPPICRYRMPTPSKRLGASQVSAA